MRFSSRPEPSRAIYQALFGPYRHVLEIRGETVLDATLSLWEPYANSLLRVLDDMPAESEVDVSLLVRLGRPLNVSHA